MVQARGCSSGGVTPGGPVASIHSTTVCAVRPTVCAHRAGPTRSWCVSSMCVRAYVHRGLGRRWGRAARSCRVDAGRGVRGLSPCSGTVLPLLVGVVGVIGVSGVVRALSVFCARIRGRRL